ncbi:MAG TPA: amidohydrolase family protein [Solirubrobacterales bacterium]|jgi:predicted TIM-barrel fold metal-dependent hydrolase
MAATVDALTYALPAMELVYERGTPQFRGQWPVLEQLLAVAAPQPGIGDWADPYLYLPGTGEPVSGAWPHVVTPPNVTLPKDTDGQLEAGILHDNPDGRLRAMDAAGVDVQLITPGPSIDACITLPANLAAGVLGAYNRYVATYCEADSQRLKAIVQVHGAEPHWSAREIRELAGDPSVAGVAICLPVKLAPDAENYAPIWRAVQETGLPVVQRPGFAAAIWTPRRLLSYLRQSGVLDRYPELRFAFTGFGTDWLDDAVAGLARERISVTVTGHEPAEEAARVVDVVGKESVLWGSTFPYCEGSYVSTQDLGGTWPGLREEVTQGTPAR